jgi:hypothetical protein
MTLIEHRKRDIELSKRHRIKHFVQCAACRASRAGVPMMRLSDQLARALLGEEYADASAQGGAHGASHGHH